MEQRGKMTTNGTLMMCIVATLGGSITLNGFLMREYIQSVKDDVRENRNGVIANSENIKRASEALTEVERRLGERVTSLEIRHEIEDRMEEESDG